MVSVATAGITAFNDSDVIYPRNPLGHVTVNAALLAMYLQLWQTYRLQRDLFHQKHVKLLRHWQRPAVKCV